MQWFEFHNSAANLSVFVIRGTASATDVVKDFDIWNEVALPQLLASILRECAALHALGKGGGGGGDHCCCIAADHVMPTLTPCGCFINSGPHSMDLRHVSVASHTTAALLLHAVVGTESLFDAM